MNPEARYLLGETLIRLGKETEAVSAFKYCLELSLAYKGKVRDRLDGLLQVSIQPWLISRVLGEIAWSEERFAEAYQNFTTSQKGPKEFLPDLSLTLEKLRENFPDDRQLVLVYARNLSLEGKYVQSVELLDELIAADEKTIKSTVDILLELLAAKPTQLEANRLLARILIYTGETEKSLEPILRLLSDTTLEPAGLNELVSEFLHVHENNKLFLIPYAHLKARMEENKEALVRYRQVLEIDHKTWERILADIDTHFWPDELTGSATFLKTDCLLAGDRIEDAFDLLRKLPTGDPAVTEEAVKRISILIERDPTKEHFSFGCYLLANSQETEKAEDLNRRGCDLLENSECLDLKIELAETFQHLGKTDKAAAIFKEVLAETDNEGAILKRIERVSNQWADREISAGMERLDGGSAGEDESARLISLTLDQDRPETAIEMLSKSSISGRLRSALLARIYLCMERPFLTLAVIGAGRNSDPPADDLDLEMLYLEGTASERIGDHGRA
ncbi:MAG: hypothetical protein KAX38_03530, partial [Candidatus Krumholzibacteria bacterium]|nr:hypothetical protein [Candidatus Krumholzibacteria bacterium]